MGVSILCLNPVNIQMFFLRNLLQLSECNSHSLENLKSDYTKDQLFGEEISKNLEILQLRYSN